jgi:uncharacterized membrane protein YesL
MKLKQGWRDNLDTWANPVFANMLWVLLSIPILTMPLALVGLLAVMFHWIDDRRTQVLSIFFGTIRRVWIKAYILFALDLVGGGFIYLNTLIFTQMELTNILALLSLSATLFTMIVFVAFNIPAWVMVATWDAPLNRILPFCIRLVFAQPFWTILLGIVFVLPFAITLLWMLPTALFITVIGAIAAYIACRGTVFLVQKYIPRDEFKLLDVI